MPRTDGSLEPGRMIMAVVNVTPLKAAERGLAELVKSKDELVASVSHELRTPITTIMGLSLELRDNTALLQEATGGNDATNARHALEVMGTYERAQAPQPSKPVIRPAEIRLMWVPDHLNAAGDLVPAHYYYLRVLDDRWAVQDAFDLEQQLNGRGRGVTSSGATPWVYGDDK